MRAAGIVFTLFVVVCLVFLLVQIVLAENVVTLKIPQGELEGRILVTQDGKTYHSYQGIPYAKPPLGELRFQAPQSPEPWTGVWDAKQEGSICKSFDLFSGEIAGDENCLFLNVYTPKISADDSRLLPVMFWIHGGGFQAGSGTTKVYGPDWLVEEDVVVVTINYRLGVMGFLSLDVAEASGNSGLKDQVAALRWVHENIAKFGGNPNDVTVFGQSAGGASTNYFLLSDLTKGLFHKAIPMSGSSLNPWARIMGAKEMALKLCEKMGLHTANEYEALKFLRNAAADKIFSECGKQPPTTVMADFNMNMRDLVFLPTIEKKFTGQEAFLDEPIMDKVLKGNFRKVPVMTGYTDAEGLFAMRDVNEDPVLYGMVGANFERYIPHEMCIQDGSEKSREVAEIIKKFYYGDKPVNESSKDDYVRIKSDTWFSVGIDRMVRGMLANTNQPIFYYIFSFDEFGVTKYMNHDEITKGATHAEDLGYLFKHGVIELPRNITNVETTRRRMVKMYTNFAKTGNPTPEISDLLPVKWEPITKDKMFYFDIDKDLHLLTNPDEEALQFWRNLQKNENDCYSVIGLE